MTDEEIYAKNKIVIEAYIDACVKEYGFRTKAAQDEFIERYKQKFIARFREGMAKAKIAIAKKMLAEGMQLDEISKLTALSKEQIEKLI